MTPGDGQFWAHTAAIREFCGGALRGIGAQPYGTLVCCMEAWIAPSHQQTPDPGPCLQERKSGLAQQGSLLVRRAGSPRVQRAPGGGERQENLVLPLTAHTKNPSARPRRQQADGHSLQSGQHHFRWDLPPEDLQPPRPVIETPGDTHSAPGANTPTRSVKTAADHEDRQVDRTEREEIPQCSEKGCRAGTTAQRTKQPPVTLAPHTGALTQVLHASLGREKMACVCGSLPPARETPVEVQDPAAASPGPGWACVCLSPGFGSA